MVTTIASALPESPRPTYRPRWWSVKGDKMEVGLLDLERRILTIKNNEIAVLTIEPAQTEPWKVSWRIVHFDGEVSGYTLVSREILEVAFRLYSDPKIWSQYEAEWSPGHLMKQGAFVRFGNYLNIPNQGTGHNGDANISIHVDEAIREAVHQLLNSIPH